MPHTRRPLPSGLGAAFRYSDARAAGASRKRLRARDLEAPYRGVRRRVEEVPAPAAGPLARDRAVRDAVVRDARAYLQVMADHAFFSGRTAAVIHGLPVTHGAELEVAVFAPRRAPRRAGIRGRKVAPDFAHVVTVDGMRVADPASCWAMLGSTLGERDLIRLGDAIVRIPRGPGGRPQPERQLATLAELRVAASVPGRPGRARLLRALARIRVGSMSPLETDARLEEVDAGLPEPELDVEIRDRSGHLVGIADQCFAEYHVLVEVEGDHHRTDRAQWQRDIEKVAAYTGEGYETVRLVAAQVRTHPGRGVALIRDALMRGGWTPERE